jgi:hypothetical protein
MGPQGQGTQGIQGRQGLQGNVGFSGANGIQGIQGIQGDQGTQGIQGTQSVQGIQGVQGNFGPQGTQGTTGNNGVSGNQGTQGIQGPEGGGGGSTQGIQGIQGADGTTGSSGTGFVGSRTTAQATTPIIVDSSSANLDITGFKGYVLYKIQTSHAAWVRLYVSDAARTADSSRAQGADPAYDAGVITEVITTGAQTIVLAPAVHGFNDESPVTTNVPIAVTNLSGSSTAIIVTLTLLQAEA